MVPPLRVLLFAGAREAAGTRELLLELGPGDTPVTEVLRVLQQRHPRLGPILASSRLVRNGEYLRGRSGSVRPGDEFAVHPPYSGG
ncbi:MAG TPA: MoaD/ThiS family protein [Thermoplasmata archaeon]|nr:MoaD/ThiS family protein [Thermoplasmata archaeon]